MCAVMCFPVCGHWPGVINTILLLWGAKGFLCPFCCTALKVLKVHQGEGWPGAELLCWLSWKPTLGGGEAEQKLWPSALGSPGEAETGKSGAAEAAAVWALCKLGTRGVLGFSCKMLSAENAESLPAFEGQFLAPRQGCFLSEVSKG